MVQHRKGSEVVKVITDRYSVHGALFVELARIRAGEITEQGYVILHKDIPVKIIKKVCIPIKEHPKVSSHFIFLS